MNLNRTHCMECGRECLDHKGNPLKQAFYSVDGVKEFKISGLCEPCFDELTDLEDDEDGETDDEVF